jgi:S-DNA-T family DNA segregation ATPase FtsK/SpoIIIE
MRRDIAAVVVFAAAVALGLALVSFSASDAPLVARGLPAGSNLVGPVGHRMAVGFYRVLGLSALIVPIGLGLFAWKLFRDAPRRITLLASLAHAVLALSVATLAHLLLAGRHLTSFPPGGAVGRVLCTRAEALFSPVGTGLIVGACAVVALIVGVDFQVKDAAGLVFRAARAVALFVGARVGDAVDRHREAVAELRAQEALQRARRAEPGGAVVEAGSTDDEDEGRAVAGALAAEQARRAALAGDPAWVHDLASRGVVDEEPDAAVQLDGGRRGKRGPAQPGAACDATDAGPVAAGVEPDVAEPDARAFPGGDEPLPPAEKPEIVLSQAMLDRKARKKDRKDTPAFTYTQSGEVFRLPSTEVLDQREAVKQDVDEGGLRHTAEIIVATLRQHGVDGVVKHIRPGPVVTLYEFIPVAGVKLAKIENLDKELTMALSATRIRIIAPIPGKGVVGIEVPNRDRATVYLREVLESDVFAAAGGLLPLALGKNIEGIPYCVDLQRMPHLLIAGTTGAGKSVGLNTMILSLLYRQTPDQVRFIMVDPKMTELSIYEDVPHLLLPVVTDPAKAARALQWAVDEMERRTQILADTGSKDLKSYNGKAEKLRAAGLAFGETARAEVPPEELLVVDVGGAADGAETSPGAAEPEPPPGFTAEYEDPTLPPPADAVAAREERQEGKKLPQKLPYIVVIIDELADLMMTAPREVEISLARLAQKARATGIHLMVATQRPSTDVVTGMIKNNFPARISFRLASRHDSSTIINGPGAESLLGDGDMLVMTATQPVTRVQGAFVSEGEIERVVKFLKEQGKPVYDESILKARDAAAGPGGDPDEDDPVYDQALDLVSRMEEVSVSKLQREMRLGYNKAAKIVERMEREGIVGPANGVKPRQVLIRPVGEASPYPNV